MVNQKQTLTDAKIEAANGPDALAALLTKVEAEDVPELLHKRIVHGGRAIIFALIDVLVDEDLQVEDGPGGGWAPIHAAKLLGELRATDAIEPLLDVLAMCDATAMLYDVATQALCQIGAAALEPTITAYPRARTEDVRLAFAEILANLGVKDDRILSILLGELLADPWAAGLLVDYGDTRALEHLSRALDECEPSEDETDSPDDQPIIEYADAIKSLGGSLTPSQQEKVDTVVRNRQSFREHLKMHAADLAEIQASQHLAKPGPNEPCPCGSGKKYTKCHQEQDEGR
jgi:hypothetical protein